MEKAHLTDAKPASTSITIGNILLKFDGQILNDTKATLYRSLRGVL